MSKAVLISIRPKWCELIASGDKTIEIRRTRRMYEVGQIVSFTPTAYKEGPGAKTRLYKKVRGTVAEINEEHRWYRLTYRLECGWEQSECFKF